MAVFTPVTLDDITQWITQFPLGKPLALKGIASGIENSNFFLTTERDAQVQEHVLTIFENLSFEQLPFYLNLMRHLADRGVAVPAPIANEAGELMVPLHGKPAAIVTKLDGSSQMDPQPVHCAEVGAMLARMHLAGRDYPLHQPNLRGLDWWNETVPVVLPYLSQSQRSLILGELAYQNHIAASSSYRSLPRGVIHADLFRDNVMFEGGQLTGFFDFYFAGCDTFLFDIGICLNDWCIDLESGELDTRRADAFMAAYQRVRPLTMPERTLLPALQRAGALRFWVSRLWDFHLPRDAAMLKPHDPGHFERVLRQRLAHPYLL